MRVSAESSHHLSTVAKPYIVRAYGEDDGETVSTVPLREFSKLVFVGEGT